MAEEEDKDWDGEGGVAGDTFPSAASPDSATEEKCAAAEKTEGEPEVAALDGSEVYEDVAVVDADNSINAASEDKAGSEESERGG